MGGKGGSYGEGLVGGIVCGYGGEGGEWVWWRGEVWEVGMKRGERYGGGGGRGWVWWRRGEGVGMVEEGGGGGYGGGKKTNLFEHHHWEHIEKNSEQSIVVP